MSRPSEPPAAFAVLHRPGRGRWAKVGAAATWAGAVAMVTAGGDWWIRGPGCRDDETEDLFEHAAEAARQEQHQ